MAYFLKRNLKHFRRSAIGLLLSATALSASLNLSEGSLNPMEKMERAFMAMDLLDVTYKPGVGSWKAFSDRMSNTGRSKFYEEYCNFGRESLQEEAERQLKGALEEGSPYAAYHLSKLYVALEKGKRIENTIGLSFEVSPATKDKVRDILKRSIEIKQARGICEGLEKDVYLLMELDGVKWKSIEGIRRLEKIDTGTAIRHYGYLACNRNEPETDQALVQLLRLRENHESWLYLADAYSSRGQGEKEALEFVEGFLAHLKKASEKPIDSALNSLRLIADQPNFSLDKRLEAAHLHQENDASLGIEDKFAAYLNYYKLLMKAKKEGKELFPVRVRDESLPVSTSEEEREVFKKLMRLAGFHQNQDHQDQDLKPDLLFNLACTYYDEAASKEDEGTKDLMIEMLVKAANKGSKEAFEKLIAFDPFFEMERVYDSTVFFLRHKSIDGLKAWYEKTNKDVFLIILSRLTEKLQKDGERVSSEILELLKRLEADEVAYIPVLDLKILDIQKQLSSLERYIKDARDRIDGANYHGLGSVFIPLDAYHQSGYHFDTRQDAQAYLDKLNSQATDMKKEIEGLQLQQKNLLNSLSAGGLYALAQEYDLINRAEEALSNFHQSPLFRAGYLSLMEKAADQGFKSAVEDLIDLYRNGYPELDYHLFLGKRNQEPTEKRVLQSEGKVVFYETIQALLANEDLSLLEKAARLKEIVAGKTFSSGD